MPFWLNGSKSVVRQRLWRVSGSSEEIQPSSRPKYSWKCFSTTEMKVYPLGWCKQWIRSWLIVLWSRHEMTHHLWPYTPRKRTLGQCDYWHTVGQCIFEPSTVSLTLTGVNHFTGCLKNTSFMAILRVTVQEDKSSMLSQSLWFIQNERTFL